MRKKRFFRRAVYDHPNHIYVPERSPNKFSSWLSSRSKGRSLSLELGMGTGDHLIAQAAANPDRFFLGVEIKPDRIYSAFVKASERSLENIVFLQTPIERLHEYSLSGFQEIFILFPDPWPKDRHTLRRLSSPPFLRMYQSLLSSSGKIILKTDHSALFEYSLESFRGESWNIIESDRNYLTPEVFQTSFEKHYLSHHISIFFAQAMKPRRSFSIRKTFSRLLHSYSIS